MTLTTEQFIRFHKNKLDEMLRDLDSAKYARAFQANQNLTQTLRKRN